MRVDNGVGFNELKPEYTTLTGMKGNQLSRDEPRVPRPEHPPGPKEQTRPDTPALRPPLARFLSPPALPTFAILPRSVPGQAEEGREEDDRGGHRSIPEPHLISTVPRDPSGCVWRGAAGSCPLPCCPPLGSLLLLPSRRCRRCCWEKEADSEGFVCGGHLRPSYGGPGRESTSAHGAVRKVGGRSEASGRCVPL